MLRSFIILFRSCFLSVNSSKNVKYNFSAFFFLPKGCLILISPIESKKPPKGKTDELILFGEFSTDFHEDSEILSNDFNFT